MSERIELPNEDLTKFLPSVRGEQTIAFGLEGEWSAEMTPQQVMKLAGHAKWADLKEGDIVGLVVFGRGSRRARVTNIAFNDEGEPSYSFEWLE